MIFSAFYKLLLSPVDMWVSGSWSAVRGVDKLVYNFGRSIGAVSPKLCTAYQCLWKLTLSTATYPHIHRAYLKSEKIKISILSAAALGNFISNNNQAFLMRNSASINSVVIKRGSASSKQAVFLIPFIFTALVESLLMPTVRHFLIINQ